MKKGARIRVCVYQYQVNPTALERTLYRDLLLDLRDKGYYVYWDHDPNGWYVEFNTWEEAIIFKLVHL